MRYYILNKDYKNTKNTNTIIKVISHTSIFIFMSDKSETDKNSDQTERDEMRDETHHLEDEKQEEEDDKLEEEQYEDE